MNIEEMTDKDIKKLIKFVIPKITSKDLKMKNGFMYISKKALNKQLKEKEKIIKKFIKTNELFDKTE